MARGITRFAGSSRLAKEMAVSHGTVVSRMRAGMSLEEARADLQRRAEMIAAGMPGRGPAVSGATSVVSGATAVSGPTAVAGAAGPPVRLNPAAGRFARFAKPDSRHPRPDAKIGVAAVVGAPSKGNGKSNGNGNGHQAVDPAPGVVESMYQAQLRKEIALADQQRLKADEMAGRLIDRTEASRWYANIIVKLRDTFLRIGAETADRLATETIPAACRKIVDDKIIEALSMMKEYRA
jgi:hypothetical protein